MTFRALFFCFSQFATSHDGRACRGTAGGFHRPRDGVGNPGQPSPPGSGPPAGRAPGRPQHPPNGQNGGRSAPKWQAARGRSRQRGKRVAACKHNPNKREERRAAVWRSDHVGAGARNVAAWRSKPGESRAAAYCFCGGSARRVRRRGLRRRRLHRRAMRLDRLAGHPKNAHRERGCEESFVASRIRVFRVKHRLPSYRAAAGGAQRMRPNGKPGARGAHEAAG